MRGLVLRLEFEWTDDAHLVVRHAKQLKPLHQEQEVNGVQVTYWPFDR